jgi:hypothetical protein
MTQTFGTLRDYARATGQDANSIRFDPRDFTSFTMPNNRDVCRPNGRACT